MTKFSNVPLLFIFGSDGDTSYNRTPEKFSKC